MGIFDILGNVGTGFGLLNGITGGGSAARQARRANDRIKDLSDEQAGIAALLRPLLTSPEALALLSGPAYEEAFAVAPWEAGFQQAEYQPYAEDAADAYRAAIALRDTELMGRGVGLDSSPRREMASTDARQLAEDLASYKRNLRYQGGQQRYQELKERENMEAQRLGMGYQLYGGAVGTAMSGLGGITGNAMATANGYGQSVGGMLNALGSSGQLPGTGGKSSPSAGDNKMGTNQDGVNPYAPGIIAPDTADYFSQKVAQAQKKQGRKMVGT